MAGFEGKWKRPTSGMGELSRSVRRVRLCASDLLSSSLLRRYLSSSLLRRYRGVRVVDRAR